MAVGSDSHVVDKWTPRGAGADAGAVEFHAGPLRAFTTAENPNAQRRPDERQTGTEQRPRPLPLPASLLLDQSKWEGGWNANDGKRWRSCHPSILNTDCFPPKDISIGGQCVCHGHAATCSYNGQLQVI